MGKQLLVDCALSFLNTEHQAREQYIPFIKVFGFTQSEFKPPTTQTLSRHLNHYTTKAGCNEHIMYCNEHLVDPYWTRTW